MQTRLVKGSAMKRKHLPRDTRHFVRWAQKDRCFLCTFPLVIYCHVHHIISVENCGPDHYLNLIGLCANHHDMLENLKRTQTPSNSLIGTSHPKMVQWHYKIQAALAEFDKLEYAHRKAMDRLLAPYLQSGDSLCGIFEKDELLKLPLVRMVVDRDIELLKEFNSIRPRIFFKMVGSGSYDLLRIDQVELQMTIDQAVSMNVHNVGSDAYDLVVAEHLLKLGLPGSRNVNDKKDRFHFKTGQSFSVHEIREMSDNQIYSL